MKQLYKTNVNCEIVECYTEFSGPLTEDRKIYHKLKMERKTYHERKDCMFMLN